MNDKNLVYVGGVSIAAALILSSFVLSHAIIKFRTADRSVSVRGLAEREVKADLAQWPLKVKVSGNDLVATNQALQSNVDAAVAFLKAKGLTDEEIRVQGLRVLDRKSQEYGEAKPDQMRYIIESTISIRSSNVEKVNEISRMTSDLVKSGVALSSGEGGCDAGGPTYTFTKLNDIKPAMLAEATKAARKAAEQFAADSGSAVGQIKSASQGLFSIASSDQMDGEQNNGGCGKVDDINKKVRVVTSLDYFLQD